MEVPPNETPVPQPSQREETTVVSTLSAEERDNLQRSIKKIKRSNGETSERNQDPETSNEKLQDEGREQRRKISFKEASLGRSVDEHKTDLAGEEEKIVSDDDPIEEEDESSFSIGMSKQ